VLKDITLDSRCRNLVLASPLITLGKTTAYAIRVVSESASSVGICWLAQLTMNLGQDPLANKWFSWWDRDLLEGDS